MTKNTPMRASQSSNMEINQYMRRLINETPMLSEEEEVELVTRWCEQKDYAARNRLVEAHGRLVANMVKRFVNSGAEFSDLLNEGYIALTLAADRFDLKRKNRFSTYAAWWVLSGLQDAVHRDIYSVKIGRSRPEKKALRLLGTARQYLGPNLDTSVFDTISDISGCPIETVRKVDGAISSRSISMNASISQENETGEMGDTIEDENANETGAEAQLVMQGQKRILEEALCELSDPRASKILRERYLFVEDRSLRDIGADLDISSERVRQIEKDAIQELQTILKKKGFGLETLMR
jgi:RNA polymerase sigma-32 factor